MPSCFCNGKSRHSLPRTATWVCLVALLGMLAYGGIQFARFAEPFSIEWAGQASSIWLRFGDDDAFSGRVILVSHTPSGQRMTEEYLRINKSMDEKIIQEQYPHYSIIHIDPQSMHTARYLDYLAVAWLKLMHARDTFFTSPFPLTRPDTPANDVHIQPIFTRGLYQQADNTLVNHLRGLVQNAAPASSIRISVFLFFYSSENEPLLLDLLAAAERGVNVQILTDLPEADNPQRRGIGYVFQTAFAKRLQQSAEKGQSDSWLKNHKSVNWDSKNHTKIFLFSDSAGYRNWVIISSENLTDTEREKYQAGLLMRDPYSFAFYEKYWQQMLEGTYQDLWVATNGKNLTHYFFPQTAHQDAIYQQLDQICMSSDASAKRKLQISMARWNFERFPLAVKLVELAETGIPVEIITRNNTQIVDPIILKLLSGRPNITLHTANVDRLNIHSKYMLYQGCYRDGNVKADKKILWVGSHNFTGMAMRNNYETWTEVRDDKIFSDFENNFVELKSLVPVDAITE